MTNNGPWQYLRPVRCEDCGDIYWTDHPLHICADHQGLDQDY